MDKATGYRWLILISVFLMLTTSTFICMTFSTVSGLVSDIYHVKVIYINGCVTVFFVTQVIFNFPSVPIIERCGLAKSVSVTGIYCKVIRDQLFKLIHRWKPVWESQWLELGAGMFVWHSFRTYTWCWYLRSLRLFRVPSLITQLAKLCTDGFQRMR